MNKKILEYNVEGGVIKKRMHMHCDVMMLRYDDDCCHDVRYVVVGVSTEAVVVAEEAAILLLLPFFDTVLSANIITSHSIEAVYTQQNIINCGLSVLSPRDQNTEISQHMSELIEIT